MTHRHLATMTLGVVTAGLGATVWLVGQCSTTTPAMCTMHLPLARLVDAALSSSLPDRLRVRVAAAAFARAVVLERSDDALRVAPALKRLAPALGEDLDAYTTAAPADRHRAGLRLLLRTPGMHTYVAGREDSHEVANTAVPRAFDHLMRRNWWCSGDDLSRDANAPRTALMEMLYADGTADSPWFLTAAERAAALRERSAVAALGPATVWLGREAIAWATSRPQDLDAAEALAQVVEGARWSPCATEADSDVPRRAFQTLHRLFPNSAWAQKTPYWYR